MNTLITARPQSLPDSSRDPLIEACAMLFAAIQTLDAEMPQRRIISPAAADRVAATLSRDTALQRYPIGTTFRTGGKCPRVCTVVDFHVTRNLAGDVVRARYVATHPMCGQSVADYDVCDTTIARGLIATGAQP